VPRRSRPDVERSQAALLADAAGLASVVGLEALTLGRVAERSGLSKSGLIGRFGSKEALQLAAMDAGRATVVREIVEPALREPPGRPRLRALLEGYFSYLERGVFPGGCVMAAAAHEMDGRPGPVRDAVRAAWGEWLGLLQREARRAGFEEPEQVAFELHSLALTANWAHQLFADRGALDRGRAGVARLLDG
jgi:AcrR family transcriptional regulator